MDERRIVFEARGISKAFGGIQALRDVSLEVRAGEVHALMGENGAGKSTLMNIVAGLVQPDTGELRLAGQRVVMRTPHEAIRHGVAMIHQELLSVPSMSVAENVMLGREPPGRLPFTVDRAAARREAKRLLRLLDAELPVDGPMRELNVAGGQTVEIARALGRDASLVIMDEPTAAISDREAEALFEAVGRLTARGTAVVYITHRMDEVFRLADRITVLRDGRNVATAAASELDAGRLIEMMVGRELPVRVRQADVDQAVRGGGACALSVRGLRRTGTFRDISFDLAPGEVVGLAGLVGAGRSEVACAIFGLVPADGGEICVGGRAVAIRHPSDAMRLGIGMVTEDRKGYGLVPDLSVMHNVTLASLAACCRVGGLIRHSREAATARKATQEYGIKAGGLRQSVRELSGGNQQKVVVARTLLARPDIVILDEPTRGIDVGAKAEIHAIIAALARAGRAVLLVSSELPELLALCDRILVMREGTLTAELAAARTSPEEVLNYAMPA